MNTDIKSYSMDMAKEFEHVYLAPERQEDLIRAATILQDRFINKNIFEINCGTGYWTEKISKTASSVFATDMHETVVEIAKQKNYGNAKVTFGIVDFYHYEITKTYDALFASFIWSHIQLQDLNSFLEKINSCVPLGGTIVFLDYNYLDGSNQPITEVDKYGNTFETITAANGTEQLIRKNFPSEEFIKGKLKEVATNIQFIKMKYYWILVYKTLAYI